MIDISLILTFALLTTYFSRIHSNDTDHVLILTSIGCLSWYIYKNAKKEDSKPSLFKALIAAGAPIAGYFIAPMLGLPRPGPQLIEKSVASMVTIVAVAAVKHFMPTITEVIQVPTVLEVVQILKEIPIVIAKWWRWIYRIIFVREKLVQCQVNQEITLSS